MAITVKEFCEIYKCEFSSIYKKIHRKMKSGELSELNVYKEDGVYVLDEKAEEILKPTIMSELKRIISDKEDELRVYQNSDVVKLHEENCRLRETLAKQKNLLIEYRNMIEALVEEIDSELGTFE